MSGSLIQRGWIRLKANPPLAQPLFWLVVLLFACSPTSRTVANHCSFLLMLSAIWVAWRTRKQACVRDPAAAAWLLCTALAFAMLFLAAALWGDRMVYSLRVGRLLPAAFAAWLIGRSVAQWNTQAGREWITHAFAATCVAAAGVTFFYGRETPTNPIPWAVCAGMCVAVLVPRSMDTSFSAACRWAWAAASMLGILGVIWSLTRGAYGILPWAALVWLVLWRRGASGAGRRTAWVVGALAVLAGSAMTGIVVTTVWTTVQSPGLMIVPATSSLDGKARERIEQGVHELVIGLRSPESVESANTSVGGRILLWRIAADAFAGSPLVGVGNRGLAERIGSEASRLNSVVLRYADDQAHNEYLQVAAMYGLWGIAAFLLITAGLVLAAVRAASDDPHAAWQLAGVTFMHATGALTNVNFSQNYYGIMMGLVVALVLLSRRKRSG